MAALAFALHILGAVVWVGGMFAIYVCLRPALVTLEPPQRLRLMRVTFQKFFPWAWMAVLLLLASGYAMVFIVFGGFASVGLHVHLMQGIGWPCGYSTDHGWHSNAPSTLGTGPAPAPASTASARSSASTCRSV